MSSPITRSTLVPADPADFAATVEHLSSWLVLPAEELDRCLGEVGRVQSVSAVRALNAAAATDPQAFFWPQKLLARIYDMTTRIPDRPTAEGSIALHEVTRLLELATIAVEDSFVPHGLLDQAPGEGKAYLSWLKTYARQHRVFKHQHYNEFIHDHAGVNDLCTPTCSTRSSRSSRSPTRNWTGC